MLFFSSKTEFPRIRWASFCLVFFAIPVLLVCFWYQKIWNLREENRRARLIQRVETLLGSFQQWKDTQQFFKRLFKVLNEKILKSKNPRGEFKRYLKEVNSRFPGVIECNVICPDGEVDAELSDGKPPRSVMRRFYGDLKAKYDGNDAALVKNWSLYKSYFGPLLKPEDAANLNVFPASFRSNRTFVSFSKFSGMGMFILFFNQGQDWETIGIKDRLRVYNEKQPRNPVVLIDLEKPISIKNLPEGFLGKNLDLVLAKFQSNPRDHLWDGNTLWFQRMISPTNLLTTFVEVNPDPKITLDRGSLLGSCILFFTVLSAFSGKIMLGNWRVFLSIRVKLIALFLFSVGLPLAVLGMNARDYARELRFRLENQLFLDTEKALLLFDNKFPTMLGFTQNIFRKALSAPIPTGSNHPDVVSKRVNNLSDLYEPSETLLIDEAGDSVLPLRGKKKGETSAQMKILKPIYVALLRSLNEQNQAAELQETQAGTYAAMGGLDLDAVYADWARNLGRVREFRFGVKKGIQSTFPLLDRLGVGRFLAVFNWSHLSMEEKYIRKFLPRMERQLANTSLFAYYLDPEKPEYRQPARDFPRNFRYFRMIEPFIAKLKLQAQSLRGKVGHRDRTFFLTGIKGDDLSCFHLVAVSGDHQIRRTIDDFNWLIKVSSLAIILISLTVGWVFARKFLKPIEQLADGVTALRNRNFNIRIPILDRDELGDLSGTFNEMMESMADLEVAKIIQESLFPNEPLVSGGCSIFGTCLPAIQVGGDYFDYFPISEDRITILIGDVSGHGVPAAMVMSMAKAIVSHLSEMKFEPATVCETLNRTFLKVLKRKRMMSCFIGLIDIPGKLLIFCNAGHNHPYILRNNAVNQISSKGYPLGSVSKAKYAQSEFPLFPGDRILFYTDGLVEANVNSREIVGYPRLQNSLQALFRSDPKSSEAEIRAWHKGIVVPGPQNDDITVVVLHID